jgi:hypothetical protein
LGLYKSADLEKFSIEQLAEIKNAHKIDLRLYKNSIPYPNIERDIKITQQNIEILDVVIEQKTK